jgi:hypothetical protein
MNNMRVCWRCGDYPDVSYELEGAHWCGPCAPWAQAPCPLGPLLEFGNHVLRRLEREGSQAQRSDAERLVAWLGEAAASWPGPDPWRTVRLATQMQHRLVLLERRHDLLAPNRPTASVAGQQGH